MGITYSVYHTNIKLGVPQDNSLHLDDPFTSYKNK